MLGILYLRSIGYNKIKHAILQQNLHKFYRFKSANVLCEQFNKFINTLKKEQEEVDDKYPWLYKGHERRRMSDKEILEKYVDLEKICMRKVRSDVHVIQIPRHS